MYTDTEGIILRQTKTTNGRKMLLLFTRKFGKISAGTNISERSKGKNALAIRPFTFGRYEIFKSRDNFNINSAETKKSFYKIGEDVDKYMLASFILEFTEKLLGEGEPNEKLFDLLIEFFTELEERRTKLKTLAIAYQIKAMIFLGIAPGLSTCVSCGTSLNAQPDDTKSDMRMGFSIKDGGIICDKCMKNQDIDTNVSLIYHIDFGIVDILRYFTKKPLSEFRKVGLESELENKISDMLSSYVKYHFDIKELKTQSFL